MSLIENLTMVVNVTTIGMMRGHMSLQKAIQEAKEDAAATVLDAGERSIIEVKLDAVEAFGKEVAESDFLPQVLLIALMHRDKAVLAQEEGLGPDLSVPEGVTLH